MRTLRSLIAATIISISCVGFNAHGQGMPMIPPPVDLGVVNLSQETSVWCWAAVAQQIIMYSRGPAMTPQQCALVAAADGAPANLWCAGHPSAVHTGSLDTIRGLIAMYGGRASAIAPPTDPMTLYRTLASGSPVIVSLRSGINSGHVVVVRGMSWVPTIYGLEPVLYINDPMSIYTRPVRFAEIVPSWMGAIVVAPRG